MPAGQPTPYDADVAAGRLASAQIVFNVLVVSNDQNNKRRKDRPHRMQVNSRQLRLHDDALHARWHSSPIRLRVCFRHSLMEPTMGSRFGSKPGGGSQPVRASHIELGETITTHRDAEITRSGYARFCRPKLVDLLQALRLDAVYTRAEADYLWRAQDGASIQTLDLIGGYGAGLFGHYHPVLVSSWHELIARQAPFLAQGSCRTEAAKLAAKLCHLAGGDFVVCFTNSGTETVEAALKHVILERGAKTIVGIKGAFHGKTLGAIQLTTAYREPYAGWGSNISTIDPWDEATWQPLSCRLDDIAAVFIEPMLGEGGVRPLPEPFVQWLRTTVSAAGVPIVADEVQTGMGRTGTFLLSTQLGLEPDYICLSKSLGGGLTKLGALLIRRSRYVADFAVQHSSTFAEDDVSCGLALAAVQLMERDGIAARCAERGAYLRGQLEEVRAQYPGVIKEVRGKGLMIGIELHDLADSASKVLRAISLFDYLGYLAAAYLLNDHDIRIAPTLSSRSTLRLAPSAYIATAELDRFAQALRRFCDILQAGDLRHFFRTPGSCAPTQVIDRLAGLGTRRTSPRVAQRVAFIGHLLEPRDLATSDPTLAGLSDEELISFMERTRDMIGPAIYEQYHVASITGQHVHLSFIGLNLFAKQIAEAWRKRKSDSLRSLVRSAVELARDNGCQTVGLGGFTSILAHNGEAFTVPGIEMTTGNALTVGMGLQALKHAAFAQGIELSHARCAVVGAAGNIASIYAALLAPHVRELVLVVRDLQSSKVGAVCDAVRAAAPHVLIKVTEDMFALRYCHLIVAASNAARPLIRPEHLADTPVAICDISVPSDIDPSVEREKRNVLVIQGGNVQLPENTEFHVPGINLPRGQVFACMGETLLMGLENGSMPGSRGPLSSKAVETAMAAAAKHGFRFGGFRTDKTH
jgi:acetylornithine/succinyldiaminopimelate/putrescine aminotransferase/predicted amino acid dehydrogenase